MERTIQALPLTPLSSPGEKGKCALAPGPHRQIWERERTRVKRRKRAKKRALTMQDNKKMKLAKETWILIAIGIADLISTIFFIQRHGASEANPLFRHYWQMGLPQFITAKVALMGAPLLILEWARRQKPRLVSRALRCAIAGYVLMYGIGVARLNMPTALASVARQHRAAEGYAPASTADDAEESYPAASKEEVARLLARYHRLGKNIPPAPTLPVDELDETD